MTIYVYPAPRMSFIGADPAAVRSLESSWLDVAYNRSKQEITQQHPTAVLERIEEITQDGVPGKKAVYTIDGTESQLLVFVVDRTWFLKYRHTFPAQCAEQARKAIDEFHVHWQGRAT